MVKLKRGQEEAVAKLHNGSILHGTVGSGKSLTSLVYYVRKCGGVEFEHTPFKNPMDLYIITPAAKRDKHEWDKELTWLLIGMQPNVKVTVDSWNNLHKYDKVKNAFFVFDEQRIVGSGAWVKSFLRVTKSNQFILLTATPGDVWIDYVPMFLANGFYDSRRSFVLEHVVYHQYLNFPKIVRYNNEQKLEYYRDQLLVGIPNYSEEKFKHYIHIETQYDEDKYNIISKDRWNPWTDAPIKNAAEACYLLRKACNLPIGRIAELWHLVEKHRKIIVFYNFDYELEFIKSNMECEIAEYNGHKHQPVPASNEWVYLVQYAAGAEAWNCITTDTIVFWSMNYSHRAMIQAAGRIDRLDSPYTSLYYYVFKTRSDIDLQIVDALAKKKNFNERAFTKNMTYYK
jgi:hypothetical protein